MFQDIRIPQRFGPRVPCLHTLNESPNEHNTQQTETMSSIHIQCCLHAPAGPRAVQVSDAACETAAARSACALLPSAPSKFNRKQSGLRSQGKNLSRTQHSLSEQDFIQSIRRNTCEQLHFSEMCPVGTAHASEDLWAALDHIFVQ